MSSIHRFAYPGAVDADGHILEPPDLWERYLEPRHRDRALRIRTDPDCLEYLEIGGKPSERSRRGFPGFAKCQPRRTFVFTGNGQSCR